MSDYDKLHLRTQRGQPVGSERRCCEECGIMVWPDHQGSSTPRWTDDPLYYATSQDRCNKTLDGTITEPKLRRVQTNLTLDNDLQVFFYEQDHYCLSNFSAFKVMLRDIQGFTRIEFDTAEAAYHWCKFPHDYVTQARIKEARSAHDAYRIAREYNDSRRPDWEDVKVGCMRTILRTKVSQHEYVRRKLLETGERQLIENSWRDDFWGWGPNRDGKNMLGVLWMEVRAELQHAR